MTPPARFTGAQDSGAVSGQAQGQEQTRGQAQGQEQGQAQTRGQTQGPVRRVRRRPLAERAGVSGAVRVPNTGTGLAWRPLGEEDIPAILELIHRCEDIDHTPYRTTAEEISSLFDPNSPFASIGAIDNQNVVRALGFVRLRPGSGSVMQAVCSGAVDPTRRGQGIGAQLVDWQLDSARALLAGTDRTGPAQIVHTADESFEELAKILSSRGFQRGRSFTQLRRDLSRRIPEFDLGPHLTVEPWSQTWAEPVRRAYNAANNDGEVGDGLSAVEWSREFAAMVPDWSFVAVDRSSDRARIAGYAICARYEEDWPMLGWREGYIESLGVMSQWRHRSIGRRLISAVMQVLRDAGMDYAGIDVDSDEDEAIQNLYRVLGFEPTHSAVVWSIEI